MSFISPRRQLCVYIACFFLVWATRAQSDFTGYWQPNLALNYAVSTNYSHNFSIAKRTFIFEEGATAFRIRQLDLVHFSKLKIGIDQSIGLGVQYRFREWFETDRNNELRLTQQYNRTFKRRKYRYGHRVRWEQRITKAPTIHRFRYRFAIDFPLQGGSLDIGETYLVATTESLLSVANKAKPEWDQRLTFLYGWLANEKMKLQWGTQLRAENYGDDTAYIAFLMTGLVFSL